MTTFIIILLICLGNLILDWFLFWKKRKVEQYNYQTFLDTKKELEQEINSKKQELTLITDQKKQNELLVEESLKREKEVAAERLSSYYQEKLQQNQKDLLVYSQKIQAKKDLLQKDLIEYKQKIEASLHDEEASFNEQYKQIEQELKDYKKLRDNVVKAIIESDEKENNFFYRINISENDRHDILILEEKVIPLLKTPDPIKRLIWTLYIQKPFTELLDRIIPNKELSGIYKITSLSNKKSYIGRSTNVRNRLQEHVKSSLGVGNIADQRIHEVMREEGIWNFSFELLEEVSKDKLNEREKYYITFFETNGASGYNMTNGG